MLRSRHVRTLIPTGEAPLLLSVGFLPGARRDAILDLDGNAAEWAVARRGSGIALGPGADPSYDARSDIRPAPAYTGLRVVLGSGH
jgi:hypothetical protein